jgi:aspartokinase
LPLGSRISEEIMQAEVGRILELEEEIQHHCQKIASVKAQVSSQVGVLAHFLEQLY